MSIKFFDNLCLILIVQKYLTWKFELIMYTIIWYLLLKNKIMYSKIDTKSRLEQNVQKSRQMIYIFIKHSKNIDQF